MTALAAELLQKCYHLFKRDAGPTIESLDAAVQLDDARRKQSQDLQDAIYRFLKTALSDRAEELQSGPGGVHGVGDLVEDGSRGVSCVVVQHNSLPRLHGLVTRYVAGAFLVALGRLQRRAWTRRAAGSRSSGATDGGMA